MDKITILECCDNCAFVMKKKGKLICVLSAGDRTQGHYLCEKFISKITLANDKAERKI